MKKIVICMLLILALATSSFAMPNKISFKSEPYKFYNNNKKGGKVTKIYYDDNGNEVVYDNKLIADMVVTNRIIFGVTFGTCMVFTFALASILCYALFFSLATKVK